MNCCAERQVREIWWRLPSNAGPMCRIAPGGLTAYARSVLQVQNTISFRYDKFSLETAVEEDGYGSVAYNVVVRTLPKTIVRVVAIVCEHELRTQSRFAKLSHQ